MVIIEAVRRFKLNFLEKSAQKYMQLAKRIDKNGEDLFISIMMKPNRQLGLNQERGFNFPVVLLMETCTFRTNLELLNVQNNSNVIDLDHLSEFIKDENNFYYILKKVEHEFKTTKP